jgi:hypothetical protein
MRVFRAAGNISSRRYVCGHATGWRRVAGRTQLLANSQRNFTSSFCDICALTKVTGSNRRRVTVILVLINVINDKTLPGLSYVTV